MKKLMITLWIIPLIFGLMLTTSCSTEDEDITPQNTVADETVKKAPDKIEDEDEDDHRVPRIPFADAEVFFEFNSTDFDLGLQIFVDAEGWEKVRVFDPEHEEIVRILPQGSLAELGITELRFESAEPSPAEVLSLFPEGIYKFRGKTVEGFRLFGRGELSHDLLPAPTFMPSHGEVVDPENTTVFWNAPGAELVEIIIESEDLDDVFDVIVSGELDNLDIPSQFLQPGTEYKMEILSYSENGNRTITESTFNTAE